jgi:AcrR family transcriptional regulator
MTATAADDTADDATAGSGEPGPARTRRRPGRPRSRRADDAIAEATIELLQRHGIGGLSIEAVARRAGVAKTTIYRRWPTKKELVLDALANVAGPVITPPAGGSVREDLIFLLTASSSKHRNPSRGNLLTRRLISEADAYPDLAQDYFARVIDPRHRSLQAILQRGVDENLIRPDADLVLAAETLIAPILLSAWLPFGPRSRPPHIPDLVDLVLGGLSPPAAAPPRSLARQARLTRSGRRPHR